MKGPQCLADWLVYIEHCHTKIIDLGLERIAAIAQSLELLPFTVPVITVGGTNGKGSCVRVLTDIYQAAGYQTGTYFSPHLFQFNERILLGGQPVSDALLCQAFAAVEGARAARPLSYFEFVTLAALWIFKQQACEVVILEVGLGGRLDAVNVVDADIAVITSIGLDHMEWLGHTIEEIAGEKAGIFRPGKVAVLGPKANLALLHRLAAEQGIAVHVAFPTRYATSLPTESVGAAEVVVAQLQDRLPVSQAVLVESCRHSHLAGRFHRIPGPVLQVFDVAHNPQGAAWLADQCRLQLPGRRILAVWSSYQDKDLSGIVAPLRGQIDQWFVAASPEARSASAQVLAQTLCDWHLPVQAAASLQAAYQAALDAAAPGDVLLVFGGFAIVSVLLAQALSTASQEALVHG